MLLALKKRLTAEADRGIKSALRLSHQFLFRCEVYTLCSLSLQSTKCGPQQASWEREPVVAQTPGRPPGLRPLCLVGILEGSFCGTPSTAKPWLNVAYFSPTFGFRSAVEAALSLHTPNVAAPLTIRTIVNPATLRRPTCLSR